MTELVHSTDFNKPTLNRDTVHNLRKRAIREQFPITETMADWLAENAFGGPKNDR
ncbi:MAG: hypothetical protein AAGK25_11065 [Pseudomonadota bacterium]